MSGTGRALNQLATLLLGLTGLLMLVYVLILIFPQLPLNPFRPALVAGNPLAPNPTITPTPSVTRPPTWTPTATPGPTDTPGPSPTPSDTPPPSPTRPPVASRTFTQTPTRPGPTFSPFKFTKTNDPIALRADPYGASCGTWLGVAGQVLDRDGAPLPNVSVVGWGGPVTEQNKRVFVSGSSPRINDIYRSPAAYEIYIGAAGEFDVSLQIYENGQPVSDVVRVRTSSACNSVLAVVHFQRNH